MSFTVFEESVYISRKVFFYLDLPCVATVYLLLVIEFRVFCMSFLKIGVFICFLTYDKYYCCFRTDAYSAKFFLGIINI